MCIRDSLTGGDAGRAGAEPGGVRLLAAVEGGTDVNPAFVYLQHLQIELRETGVGVELDVIPPGGGIGDNAIAELDLDLSLIHI